MGFLAGFIGLLVHAVGANTFIIVRIMEPFWFILAIVIMLPELEGESKGNMDPQQQIATNGMNGAQISEH